MMAQHFKENIMRIEVEVRTYRDDNHCSYITGCELGVDVSDVKAQNVKLTSVIDQLVQSCVAEHIELVTKDK